MTRRPFGNLRIKGRYIVKREVPLKERLKEAASDFLYYAFIFIVGGGLMLWEDCKDAFAGEDKHVE